MAEMPELAARWQARLDEAFPDGVIIASTEVHKHAFPIPRPEVVAMHGINPVVFLNCPGYGRTFTHEIVGWDTVQESPCHLVRVTIRVDQQPQQETELWSSNVSAAQARAMHASRAESMQLSEQGKVYQGQGWFG